MPLRPLAAYAMSVTSSILHGAGTGNPQVRLPRNMSRTMVLLASGTSSGRLYGPVVVKPVHGNGYGRPQILSGGRPLAGLV